MSSPILLAIAFYYHARHGGGRELIGGYPSLELLYKIDFSEEEAWYMFFEGRL